MSNLSLKIEFYSPWSCGSGLSAGADADTLAIKNSQGLPYIPGKTIKGLIREAVEDYASLRGINLPIDKAFGIEASEEGGNTTQKGTLFFTNAELSEAESASILSAHAENLLYINKVETAIGENGITLDHSLRTIETTIPCTLYAQIMHVDEELGRIIPLAVGFIKHMGTGRNRGLGRCRFTIEKGGLS